MAYFDHFAKAGSTRIGDYFSNLLAQKEYKIILKHIPPDKKIQILEIGPGRGSLAKIFIRNGYKNFDIVEPNKSMRLALKFYGVRKAKNYLIPILKEKKSSYNVIICCNVFEHLSGEDGAQVFISEVQRVLKKHGNIVILSPDYLDWGKDFFNCDFSHNNPTTVRRTTQLFSNYGINCRYYRYFYYFLDSYVGWIFNIIIKIILFDSKGNSLNSKIYKLKLNFLRRFIIIGEKN